MSNTISKPVLVFLAAFILLTNINITSAQSISVETIKNNLLNNPPNTGSFLTRKSSILGLDTILISDTARISKSIKNFYSSMMEKVYIESKSVSSLETKIWMMYNDGFLIQTPKVTFAFDLINGYSGWNTQLPAALIDQIKVLFISHNHPDHYDPTVVNRIIGNGGSVLYPSEDSNLGNIPMANGDTLSIGGIHIKCYSGLHGKEFLRMYEVVTSGGLKILHSGDNQHSLYLPIIKDVDVLLLNAWVNESGISSSTVGMYNCMKKINPKIMIPGHIQELEHAYVSYESTSRLSYQAVYKTQDESMTAKTHTMVWGELYSIPEKTSSVVEKNKYLLPQEVQLFQNYPNPFNPTTKIKFGLPENAFTKLTIYDALGRLVKTLVNSALPAGYHEVEFRASELASGIYLYTLQTKEFIHSKKILLMK